MRVGINLAVLHSRRTGVGHYTASLVSALLGCAPEVDWVLLGSSRRLEREFKGSKVRHVLSPALRGPARILWEHTSLVRQAMAARLDVLHCPDFSRPLLVPCPVVSTIHDLSYWQPGQWYSPLRRSYKRCLTRWSLRRSAALVAVSSFTRAEILRRFTIAPECVQVIHCGTDFSTVPSMAQQPPYLLCVGTMETRKNLAVLLRAFEYLRASTAPTLELRLVGQPGYGWHEIAALIERSPAREAIVVDSYVEPSVLARLYAGATLLVHPSHYEGFGLPVLEAMAAGLPVVCAKAASLPEIAGSAAVYFDPDSVSELTLALARLLREPDLRSHLAAQGRQRACLFTWEACAHAHLALYRHVYELQRHRMSRSRYALPLGSV